MGMHLAGALEPRPRPRPRNSGTLEPWNLGTLDPGTLEPWNPGTLEPWNLGTLEPWNPEAAIVGEVNVIRHLGYLLCRGPAFRLRYISARSSAEGRNHPGRAVQERRAVEWRARGFERRGAAMNHHVNRREFLKAVPAASALAYAGTRASADQTSAKAGSVQIGSAAYRPVAGLPDPAEALLGGHAQGRFLEAEGRDQRRR